MKLKSISLQKHEYRAIPRAINALKDTYDIKSVILFGSKSRGDDDFSWRDGTTDTDC